MLTDKDVNHIAALARIELDDEMRKRVKRDLQAVLGYVEVLRQVQTDAVEPLYQVTGQVNRMRPDEHGNVFPMDEVLAKLLIGQAAGAENGFIKVKSVMDNDAS